MSRSRFLYLIDKHKKKIPIRSSFKFGRSTEGFNDLSPRISRTHFEIQPLSIDDPQSNLFCAQLTLKGYYLRITSNTNATEFTEKGAKIMIKHNDKIDLIHSKDASEQYTLTVHDPMESTPDPPYTTRPTRKRKRSIESSMGASPDDSLYASPTKKRPRYDANRNNVNESICFDYNNLQSLSPSNRYHRTTDTTTTTNHISLSGLMNSDCDRSPSQKSNISRSASRTPSKYKKFGSFPSKGSEDDSEDHLTPIKRKSSDNNPIRSDNDMDWDALLADTEDMKREDEEKQYEMDKLQISPKEKEQTEEDKEKERLEHDGRYSLALPIIDCHRHKLDTQRTVNAIANALKQFMSIHRHPKLRVVVMATKQYRDTLRRALKTAYDMEVSAEDITDRQSMSLDLEFAEDAKMKYETCECDERIIIYSGAWDDIVRLKENELCCQYVTNFTFWNFSGQKGDPLNKLINSRCEALSALSIAKYKTAKKKCHCYAVAIDEANGSQLYKEQNIRCVLQTRPPSMNSKSHDFVKDTERAYSDLYDTYYRIMETFYQLTALTKPLNDTFIAKDVANWQSTYGGNDTNDNEEDKDLVLHFSLQSVPIYHVPSVHEWPSSRGHWKNALDAYIQKEREEKYNKCVFYEDDKFVIIYDRYFKAKIHLLIIPRVKLKSVYDLDPMNEAHIEMMEGMIARAEWIKSGILKRNTEVHGIKYGFHAIPSMNQIHCHLISDDMDSVNMKHKKHFHSFTSNYFVPAKAMLNVIKTEQKKFKINKSYYLDLLKQNLKCHFCFNHLKTMPALKKHIAQCPFATKKRSKNIDNENDFEIVFEA